MSDPGALRSMRLFLVLAIFLKSFISILSTSQTISEHQRYRRQVYLTDVQPRAAALNRTSTLQSQRYAEYGPWGPWTESSECSRSCGGGILFQDRICLDVRADGRHSCIGPSRRYFSCNTDDCPLPSRDFRAEQCARFNTVPYNGKYYSWVPYYSNQNPCELNCMPQGGSFFARLDRSVIDGTRCSNDGSLDVCVEGQCMPVGCDRVLGSTTKEDECRVCGGDGSSCSVVKGIFDQDDFQIGYNDILLVPIGATSILIREVQPTNNYLAIRNSAGEFYLNGNWRIEYPREIRIAGTIFHYERKTSGVSPEVIRSKGPTIEPIFIVLLYQEKNLGISYEYSIPATTKTFQPDSYEWTFGDFEDCSEPCGGGVQYRPVRCIRKSNRDVVEDQLCDPAVKPEVNKSCNTQPCVASWEIGQWSPCSHSCGGGTQYRLVFCQQSKDGSTTLVPDQECNSTKPLFMRACNTDIECPGWQFNDWSECDRPCGTGNQTRKVECFDKEENKTVEDTNCDSLMKPEEYQSCSLGPCEGVEWIVSDWSGCDGTCSSYLESREVHCATEDGKVFPDSACDASKIPDLTRPCPKLPNCDPMWHTSEWTECSVTCGTGVQSRVVFCGTWENNSVIKIGDDKCDPDKKFTEKQNCSLAPCKGTWFTGPWNRCSVPCGGGERTRKILCFHEDDVVESSMCDPTEEPFSKETCNMTPCDDDEIMVLDGCKDSKYGCCPDGVTPAGFNDEDCPKQDIISANTTCEEAEYGCCSDNFTLAAGPFKKGCISNISCDETKYGCCPDQLAPAKGPNYEGCKETTNCINSTFGCCSDNETAASGPDLEGCDDFITSCENSTFGCCPDGIKPASGLEFEGCDNETLIIGDDIESSGEDCYSKTYGCCPDGLTPASGWNQTGCEEDFNMTTCKTSAFGCCEDGFTFATGPSKAGCFSDESSGDGEITCENSIFGCCPDNVSFSKGMDGEGCIPEDCSNSTFGCCPDNMTSASGPNNEGCFTEDCINSTYGCCPDNVTSAAGPNQEGCFPENCANSTYGCCPDNITLATGPNLEGCFPEDCVNSTYGCCPDNVTSAAGPNLEGCFPEDCVNSTYGCCPDNITLATGPNLEGCFPEDCANSTYGCCPDNVTSATGPYEEGCFPEDCANSTYGCCPDNITLATGPNQVGCFPEDCINSTYGCCLDNITAALGPNNESCEEIDCINSTFGCCQDNVTVASGPDFEGCENVTDCALSEYGCCQDNVTAALGVDFEGCNETETMITVTEISATTTEIPACASTKFGCCPDEVTVALGANLEGCCFGMRFGCCPDNKTAALGPTFLGCGCQTYPYGCCPDEITPAQGHNNYGCKCEHFRFGCCQDNITPATGPHFEGCACHLMYFGCCPDGKTPRLNEKGDGCGCDSTKYGCCSDGRTAATSADLSGCPCDSLPFGCCPDGHTPARTNDLRDCPCEAHRYGCCLDGKSIATGQNYEGCSCESTRFGCCLDGKTTAQGPALQGCPCDTMYYGCCADGYTPAKGPKYEGCPAVLIPKPKVSTEVCGLPKDSGPCRDFKVMWYFDVSYGSCSRFWYGGCDGNGNNFATVEECENTCIKPDGPEACLLPKTVGSCNEKIPSWYYDVGSKSCEAFTYGGCLGNNNRFVTKTACEQKCINLQQPTPVDVCSLDKDEGPCDKVSIKWYYNKNTERCEQFYYGGCKGNVNRFDSRRECEKSCVASVVQEDICRLPQEAGPCTEFRERWFYDYEMGQCHRFIYGGCDGNENNFASFYECEKQCGKDVSSEKPTELEFKTEYCFLQKDPGSCSLAKLSWHYDSSDGVCKEFLYNGCLGNQNRFKTRKECESSCFQAQDVCSLAMVKGPCSGTFTQWYYDKEQEDCIEFIFSGCQGNANRFNSKESCYQRCKQDKLTTVAPAVPDDVCSLPQEPGPCLGYYRMWFYDSSENICKSFVYGGCEGNGNRFEERNECEQHCVKKTTKVTKAPPSLLPQPQPSTNEDVCRLPVDTGPCNEEHPRWFYDAQTQSCLPFVFGGCGGNKNRFKTSEICLRFCIGIKALSVREEPISTTTPLPSTSPTQCPPSNCAEIQCPYGIEESFDANGCSTCRCSNPCEVLNCPEGSQCAIEVMRTSREGVRTEPVCRRIHKSGVCPAYNRFASEGRDCETRCRDDADCRGEHKCCNNGCAFNCMAPADELLIPATQPEPARILPGVNITEGRIGEPAKLPCNAIGWPRPTVTWWRDTTMLPLSSRRYEQLSDYALLIRSVVYEDKGDYSCHAHNGIASGAIYKVTLIIELQPDTRVPYSSEDGDSRDSEPVSPFYALTTPRPPPVFNEPLQTKVSVATNNPATGSPLQVDCMVKGPPSTSVTWTHGNSEIVESDRRRILSNHTLYITKAQTDDTGEYKCLARFDNNVASSSVYVTVNDAPEDTSCVDNPQFLNCEIIIKSNYCNNKIYGKFCCASCLKAGQLQNFTKR